MDTSDPRCWHRRGDHSAARESGKQECRHPESLLLGRVRSGRVSKRGAHPWRGRNGGHARREGNLTGRIVPRAAGRSSIASFLRKIKLGSLATAGRDVEDRVHHCAVGLPGPPALLCRRQERCDQRHSRSVKSLGYPAVFRLCSMRVVPVQGIRSFGLRGEARESQPVDSVQLLLGQAPRKP